MKRLLILCLTLLLLTGCRTTEPQETTPEAAMAADTLPELDKLPEETEISAETEEAEKTEALPVPDAGNTPAAEANTPTGEQPTAVPEQKPAETNPEPAETEEPEETEKTPAPADPPAEPEKPEDPAVIPPETEETRKDTEPLPEPAPEPAVSTPDTPAIPEIRTGMRDIDLPDVSNPEKLGFDGGNLSMGGRMCGDGNGWVYFCQQYTGNSGRGLYKARLDGTDAVKLTDDYPAKSINVLDGWVYYCGTSDEYLIRIRTDGTDRQVLLNRVCDDLHAAESGLYFTALDDSRNPSVYYMSHDGKTMALLLEDTEMAAYWNGQVYGVSYDLLSRYAIHTGIIEDFPINVVSGYTMADDTGFYYQGSEVGSHTQCFYRYTPGGDAEVLDMNHLYYNYQNGKLYYYGYNNAFSRVCLYSVSCAPGTAGGQPETVIALSEYIYDNGGNFLDILWMDYRLGNVLPDDRYLGSDGVYDVYNETITETYFIEDCMYGYAAQIYDSAINHGMIHCIAQIKDGEAKFWN